MTFRPHEGPPPDAAARERLSPPAAAPLSPIVVRFGRLGDMIMLTSVLHLLRHRYQKACIVLGAGAWNSAVFRGYPQVARVYSFARHIPFMLGLTWWRVLWVLHGTAPSPVYVCERHPRQLVRIRRLLAWSGIDPARCLFVMDMPSDGNEHWVDRFVRFGAQTPAALRAADYPLPHTSCGAAPRLQVLDSERHELDAWIAARGWPSRRPLVLVQPGNFRSMSRRRDHWRPTDDKAWPSENWVKLFEKIRGRLPDTLVVLCGAPPEAPMLRQLQAATNSPDVVVADLPLRLLFALCDRAHSMVSIDTGPAHAAAALSLPLVVMYGAENPRLWLPRGPAAAAVLGVGGPPGSVRVDQIPVDEVFRAWCSLQDKMSERTTTGCPL
jgi:ADP-heptose:LPS heptosyltransferase